MDIKEDIFSYFRTHRNGFTHRHYKCETIYCNNANNLQSVMNMILLDGGFLVDKHWRKAKIHCNRKYHKICIDKKCNVIRLVRLIDKESYTSYGDTYKLMEEL